MRIMSESIEVQTIKRIIYKRNNIITEGFTFSDNNHKITDYLIDIKVSMFTIDGDISCTYDLYKNDNLISKTNRCIIKRSKYLEEIRKTKIDDILK